MRYSEYVCELCGGCSSVVERLVVVQDVVGSIPISRPIYSFTNIHLRSRMFTTPLSGATRAVICEIVDDADENRSQSP